MLTLPQIARRVSRYRREGSRYVRITYMKKGYDSLGRGYAACASYSTHIIGKDGRPYKNEKPNKYVTVITFLDIRLHVLVSCSCPDFLYRWEYALTDSGAAEIEYSNGEFPIIRNPSLKTSYCKHLLALYEKIKPMLPKPKRLPAPKKEELPAPAAPAKKAKPVKKPAAKPAPTLVKKTQAPKATKPKPKAVKPPTVPKPPAKTVKKTAPAKPAKPAATKPKATPAPSVKKRTPVAPAPVVPKKQYPTKPTKKKRK